MLQRIRFKVNALLDEVGVIDVISEEQLNAFRLSGQQVRVVRDNMEQNDVLGIVVAWDDESVMIRKRTRRVVKLSRQYAYIDATCERPIIG